MSDLGKHLIISEPLVEPNTSLAKPYIGYIFMILFVVSNSLADSTSKLLFLAHPNLGVQEMLFLRGVIFLVILVALLGRDFKHILFDSVPREMVVPLIIRCTTGLCSFFCFCTAIKHLPIILVALY